jgi:large subunit ribosomal protein L14
MIFKESRLLTANRCGVYKVRVINVYNKLKRSIRVGFFCKTSNVEVSLRLPFLKKKKNKSFYVRSVFPIKKPDGSYIKFSKNSLVLLKKRLYIKGGATFGPIPITIRRRKAISSFIKKIIYVQ